ncbi:MAG TPA: flippase activity-associated protein Agl23 [Candidatus Angelobacter sp.]|nr:flippase activity-associated protein Agl23 [Candidatus Angelobacter sp.]
MKPFPLAARWTRWTPFVLVALLGLLIRLPHLGSRPMHTDESVNAYIVGQLLAGRSFNYDPHDRHGPLLAALALPIVRMQGATNFSELSEAELRLTSVVAGTVTILLFGAAVDMFGFVPCLTAALVFACASLPVYFDRYFIHESLFVAATFGLIVAGWRARRRPPSLRAVIGAACAALMLASKETAALHFLALLAAAFVYWRWNLRGNTSAKLPRSQAVVAALVAFLLVTFVLFTWFGSNWKALTALLQAVPHALARAGGEGHQKPFWYFAQLLTADWSGKIIIALACIGFFQSIRKREPTPFGYLAFYFLSIVFIYSLIPYKTPWLALNFWLPIALFSGVAVDSLLRIPASYPAVRIALPAFYIAVALAAAALIARDTRQHVFLHPADESNAYAYAHTSEDLLGLPGEIDRLARQNMIAEPRISVIISDPWPLPWYLRKYSQVGFWQPGQHPEKADFYITSTEVAEQYQDPLQNFRPEFFGARPGVLILLWSHAAK